MMIGVHQAMELVFWPSISRNGRSDRINHSVRGKESRTYADQSSTMNNEHASLIRAENVRQSLSVLFYDGSEHRGIIYLSVDKLFVIVLYGHICTF